MKPAGSFAVSLAVLISALPTVAQTTTRFQDAFTTPGSKLDLNNWTTVIGPTSFLGRTQLADWVTPGGVGQFVVGQGGAQLALNTFNPTGSSLYGTHGRTLQSFQPAGGDSTIVFTTLMQLTSLQPGIVYGMYLYLAPQACQGCPTLHDEIDIEIVTNLLQPGGTPMVQLNRYANEPLGAGNAVLVNLPPGFNLLAPHSWAIRWSRTRIDYMLDGAPFFSTTTHVPQGPMQANLIAWGPDASWPAAYSASLQVANSALQNQRYFALVNSVTVTSSPGNEIGFVDAAGDTNGGPNLVKGDTLFVRGWAADTIFGAVVLDVSVYLDGSFLGPTTLGGFRPDVAQAFNRIDYTNSGWNFSAPTSALTVGTHTITAVANGVSGRAPLTGSKTINIAAAGGGGGGRTIGFVDMAGDANGLSVITKGNTMFVQGWAADSISGAPVLNVTVFIDGFSLGAATLGLPRADVAQAFGSASFQSSGWTLPVPTGGLNTGSHIITATANGPSGSAPLTGSKTVNITLQPAGQEIGFVDFAGGTDGGLAVVQGGTLVARGWAADTATGAPVQSVTVFIDGVVAGTATLGSLRPDVAAAGNRNDYLGSGWTFQMSTSGLSLATHSVTASASGPSGTAALIGNKTFQVTGQPVGQVIGFVDSAIAEGSVITVQGWAADLATGAPVQSVSVVVDGSFTVFATLGGSRPDVALTLNRQDFANSGWTAHVFFGSAAGTHTFTASATGTSGTSALVGVRLATFP